MSTSPDPFEFVRNLWAHMGVPGFAPAGGMPSGMPRFAPEELEKRIAELRQIRQWLEMNLNMLNLQVNGLEMQLAAIKGFKPGADFAAQAMRDAAAYARPDASMGAAAFPFGAAQPQAAAAPQAAPEPAPAAADPGRTTADAHPWPDPTAWMQNLQSEFVKGMRSLAPDVGAAPKAAKKAARKTGARKTTPRKGARRA
jgi:hypothetical protein